MPTPHTLQYSYLQLPHFFYSKELPMPIPHGECVLFNNAVNEALLDGIFEDGHKILQLVQAAAKNQYDTFSQGYAGHQFGHFAKLGDGRAIMLGEYVNKKQQRYDIQLKGSGATTYSRGGDGKATLRAMLREYLMSEAIHHLGISSSRSLAVINTNQPVYRQSVETGAQIIRIMKSHIRVGTFEYARYLGTIDDLKALTQYTIARLYPELEQAENPALALLHKIIDLQTSLVAEWMRVGFIHGVMNTDNTSVSGETFDYGPCAFMNAYHPQTVFSSIDTQGRYAFAHQSHIIKCNMLRFAEALLPILHEEATTAVSLAQQAIDGIDDLWRKKYLTMMQGKIGFSTYHESQESLVQELQQIMQSQQLDYTNTFILLGNILAGKEAKELDPSMQSWLNKWTEQLLIYESTDRALQTMQQHNPQIIPRNHLVEQALDEAVKGDYSFFNEFLLILQKPYETGDEIFTAPPEAAFEQQYKTFCGT